MKRRKFCRYGVLSAACFAEILRKSSASASISNASRSKLRHRWVILYWMPYDNNLVSFGETIIEMLVSATKASEAAVVVQSDYSGDQKMRRRQFIRGTTQEISVVGEDSSDVSAFSAYLDWANITFEAEHWAIIVVGHGGQINEISPDDHSLDRQKDRTWMKVDLFANAVGRFNRSTNERVELLFFQNCNKATLEVVYESRNCARYTLASQLTLGAPNYYYAGFLKYLNTPSISGREAAIAIMQSERGDMYHTLTLVDNRALKNIPTKLSRLIQSLLVYQSHSLDLSDLSTIHYFGERCCDLIAFFNFLSKNISRIYKEYAEFSNALQSSVITFYKTGGELLESNSELDKQCGLSLYLPESKQDIARYKSLALYRDVDLLRLYESILTN